MSRPNEQTSEVHKLPSHYAICHHIYVSIHECAQSQIDTNEERLRAHSLGPRMSN